MGKTNKTKTATNIALNNTPTSHLTSQGNGQPCASETTRATTTPTPRTQVLTAGMAELIPEDVLSVLTGATELQRQPETMKKTPTTKVLTASGAELILAVAGQDALQSSGVSPVHSEPQVPMAGNQDAFELTGSLKRTPPIAMAGNQDALQLSGTTSVYVIGEEEGGAGATDPRTFHTLQDHSTPAPAPQTTV